MVLRCLVAVLGEAVDHGDDAGRFRPRAVEVGQDGSMTAATESDSSWATFGFSVALQVRYPRLSTEKVSKELGLRPGRVVMAGEPRATAGGTPLAGIHRESYCSCHLAKGTGSAALEARLRNVTEKLGRHAVLLRSWRRSGGRLSYYLTVHGEAAMGFSLGPELLADIGRLGVELGVEALRARQRS
jgi:hypothetical protein